MGILVMLQQAFSLWMFVDAIQRRCEFYWYFVIWMPFGELVYFFAVKIHDPEFRSLKKRLFAKKTSLKELRYHAKSSPSLLNKTRLANGLHDEGLFKEAFDLFHEILAQDPNDKRSRHGLGICALKIGETEDAIHALEQIVEADLSYDDYSACGDLAHAYWEAGRRDDALGLLRNVCEKSHRITHQTTLAEYLIQLDRHQEAKELLQNALEDHVNSPKYIKRKYGRAAGNAKKLLRSLK